ncbi:MAG: helix-turn-helix transcriptional regulator [Planctomycetia bacterium]|nr:helix-turn-helix transcriptional regulator [Planctomycetia bacterium]
MTTQQTILVDGKPYVLLPRAEYERLTTLAKAADLPPLPAPDADGNFPAVEYARASLARKIIRDRVANGMTQRELAKLAGISVEHLCRLETGKHVPSVPMIDKIDRALKQAAKAAKPRKQKGK